MVCPLLLEVDHARVLQRGEKTLTKKSDDQSHKTGDRQIAPLVHAEEVGQGLQQIGESHQRAVALAPEHLDLVPDQGIDVAQDQEVGAQDQEVDVLDQGTDVLVQETDAHDQGIDVTHEGDDHTLLNLEENSIGMIPVVTLAQIFQLRGRTKKELTWVRKL